MPSVSALTSSGSDRRIRSRIVEWDASRRFGFVDHGGQRLFLHRRDFVRRGSWPRQGDGVSFVVGTDGKGRPCAKLVESLERRGQLRFRHWVILFLLMIVPALAVLPLPLPWSPWFSLVCLVVVSGLSYRAYRDDKNRAQQGLQRRSESSLHFVDFVGGWPGGYLAQRQYRHKTAKASFRRVFWGTILLHEGVALDFLLGWPGLRRLLEAVSELISRLPA